MSFINEDLRNAGSAITFLDHSLAKGRVIINKDFFDFLPFFCQQACGHDAIRTESGAVHAYLGHLAFQREFFFLPGENATGQIVDLVEAFFSELAASADRAVS
jgi:hypothetical protein